MPTNSLEKDLDALNGRFIQAMEELGHTGYSLSKALGTSEAVISNIRMRKNPPNIQLIRGLLNIYLDLDPDWLLFGRGSMKRSAAGTTSTVTKTDVVEVMQAVDQRIARLEKLLKRSLETQLERTVLQDEALTGIEGRLTAIEGEKDKISAAPHKRTKRPA